MPLKYIFLNDLMKHLTYLEKSDASFTASALKRQGGVWSIYLEVKA